MLKLKMEDHDLKLNKHTYFHENPKSIKARIENFEEEGALGANMIPLQLPWSYECKGTAQDRPYISRPSRTQQLLNPELVPKLTTEVLPDDPLRKDGLADKILAKADADRGRNKLLLDGETDRARSISSHSTNSIATISTNRSASASPDRRSKHSVREKERRSSVSPFATKSRKRRYNDSPDTYSVSSHSETGHRSKSIDWAEDRNIRRRRQESSPDARGRSRDSGHNISRQDRCSPESPDKIKVAKDQRSVTPQTSHDRPPRHSTRDNDNQHRRPKPVPKSRPGPPRERSLSPYSRRLALTQSMNLGQ
ncbi:hypothetical protein N7495_005535 [Penicillium taxi]|uniref:uncharacterized protein n=1 Tax=Penicillium taxi TaxID=168475 RepID=UPI0025456D8A|nr:uncharacterized protein N7495_005535 [Penicillium taxi]KAJ5893844.1 hypothetical protein N7495_005535 [Penicillium taxi]